MTASDVAGFPQSLDRLEVDLYLAAYSQEVLAAGGLPLNLPADGDAAGYVPHLDGIILTGGSDIEPWRYGAEPDGHGAYEPERDRLELALLEAALAAGIPVLGVCRGLQVINVHAGGSLHQHVAAHSRFDLDPATGVHEVMLDPTSRLHELYGDRTGVNSLHHQTVDRVGQGLIVAGRAGDGTIEALEMPDRPVMAVQWHPEMSATHEPVFDWLVAQAGRSRRAGTAVR